MCARFRQTETSEQWGIRSFGNNRICLANSVRNVARRHCRRVRRIELGAPSPIRRAYSNPKKFCETFPSCVLPRSSPTFSSQRKRGPMFESSNIRATITGMFAVDTRPRHSKPPQNLLHISFALLSWFAIGPPISKLGRSKLRGMTPNLEIKIRGEFVAIQDSTSHRPSREDIERGRILPQSYRPEPE